MDVLVLLSGIGVLVSEDHLKRLFEAHNSGIAQPGPHGEDLTELLF